MFIDAITFSRSSLNRAENFNRNKRRMQVIHGAEPVTFHRLANASFICEMPSGLIRKGHRFYGYVENVQCRLQLPDNITYIKYRE